MLYLQPISQMMKSFNIIDIINSPNAVTHTFGIKVYEVIYPLLKERSQVKISFNGLRNVTSGFTNASIGKIYIEFPWASECLTLEGVETNKIWEEKVRNAINLATNQDKIKLQNEAISELLTS